jgi:phenylalanyl-tRNA synthetase beta chain
LARTISRGARGAALFEVGHVFHPADPVDEREVVAAVLAGPTQEGWHGEARDLDFFDAKGALESLMRGVTVEGWRLGEPAGAPFHPGRSAQIEIGGNRAGVVAELDPRVAARAELPARVAVFELEVAALARGSATSVAYREVPRFPPVRRDLAFVVDAGTQAAAIQAALEDAGGDLVGSVILFDVFEGLPLPEGRKSLAYSVDFRAPDRTLTDEEADGAVEAIVERLSRDFGAQLRSG